MSTDPGSSWEGCPTRVDHLHIGVLKEPSGSTRAEVEAVQEVSGRQSCVCLAGSARHTTSRTPQRPPPNLRALDPGVGTRTLPKCDDASVQISVVVPTYGRPESLSRCLDALASQDTRADEILVVVRRNDLASRQVTGQHASDQIRPVLIDVPAGRPGLVAAMNAGADASSGQIVCLTDDDALPRADWITRLIAAFADDASIGAVGGRDWVVYDGKAVTGAEATVGTLSWYGRVVGNHHLGVGPARNVAVLKGVNLSVRGDLLRQVGFDTRLRGGSTEHHWELALCLRLLRMGRRVVYDPGSAVDHYPQPRVDESRDFSPQQVRDAAHNETLALLEHLGPAGRLAHLLLAAAVGSAASPGLARSMGSLLRDGTPKLRYIAANVTGRHLAVIAYLRTLHGRHDEARTHSC